MKFISANYSYVFVYVTNNSIHYQFQPKPYHQIRISALKPRHNTTPVQAAVTIRRRKLPVGSSVNSRCPVPNGVSYQQLVVSVTSRTPINKMSYYSK